MKISFRSLAQKVAWPMFLSTELIKTNSQRHEHEVEQFENCCMFMKWNKALNMIKSKVFLKKTRRGKVLKIVREHYLRDDIRCGLENIFPQYFCPMEDDENTKSFPQLSASPGAQSKLYQDPHFIILDTNIILNQIDILEVSFLF